MANEKVNKVFIQAVNDIFSYLTQNGFKKNEKSFKKTDTYTQITFIGQNVALSFSYDFIENVCDCEVAKVEKDAIVKSGGSSNIWLPLFSFLVDRYKYRGSAKVNNFIRFKQFAELYKFDEMLKTAGKNLIEDKLEAFD